MGNHTAFFYGTLMAPPILHRVLHGPFTPFSSTTSFSHLTIRPALLHNYCRRKVRWAEYPAIIPEDGKSVRGTYVEGLDDHDISNLDIFEGGQYERVFVKVKILKSKERNEEKQVMGVGLEGEMEEGEEKEAETYVFTEKDDLEDEYARYCASDCTLDVDPRTWWQEQIQQTSYPALSKLALNILSIPIMSADPERLFSSAKHLITDLRNKLGIDIVEAFECLKSWYKLQRFKLESRLMEATLGEDAVQSSK